MEDMAQVENSDLHTKYVTVVIITVVLWQSHTRGPWAILLSSACNYAIFVLWPECPISQITYKTQTQIHPNTGG